MPTTDQLNKVDECLYCHQNLSTMSMSEEITSYEISYYAGGRDAGSYPYRAIIKLRRGDNTLIGAAHFHREHSTMPAHDEKNEHDHYMCHFHSSSYEHIVDVLRNERPVFFTFMEGKKIGNIATSSEPVGEGED